MKRVWKKLWARKYAPFAAKSYFMAFGKKRPQWSVCQNKLFVPEGNVYGYYFDQAELEKLKKTLTSYLLKQRPEQFAKTYEKTFRQLLTWANKTARLNFSDLSNRALGQLTLQIEKKFTESGDWQVLSFIALEGIVTDTEKIICTLSAGQKIIQAILTPPKLTRITKTRLELLRAIANNQANKNYLHAYAQKYSWLSAYEFIDRPTSIQDIKARLISAGAAKKELIFFLADRKQGLASYNAFIRSLRNRPRLKQMVKITHQFSYLKDMRDDYRRPAYLALRPFWLEAAKRTGLNIIEANQLMASELTAAINGPSPKFKSLAKQRMLGYALVLKNGKFKIYAGKKAAAMVARQVLQTPQSNEIKGQTAYAGKVRGRVAVINHQSEFQKFKKNDILITTMTHPEFLPIMRQAKAIVTDEGGLTCHAAITAREFKVPCLIGTKIATKIFKDGDIIEVDANKGMVKKLKNK